MAADPRTDETTEMPYVDPRTAETERLAVKLTGHVVVTEGDKVVVDQHNLVVDGAFDALFRALMSPAEHITNVNFSFTNGRGTTPGLLVTPGSLVGVAAVGLSGSGSTPPVITPRGTRSVAGTWRAVLTPTVAITYDFLGLTMTSGELFAATAFPARTVSAGEPIAVQWTINIQG